MKLKQLSLFLENKPGALKLPCKRLTDAGINILTLSLADTQQFGILRLIVDDWKKAKETLEFHTTVVNVAEVVAIEVEDHPGGLSSILEKIEEAGINIEYMYACTFGRNGKAILIFKLENIDSAISQLQKKGINLVDSVDLKIKTR